MTELNQIYKCSVCGNIIEILHTGADSLVCCGQPMKLLEEHTKDPKLGEKHVPVIERKENIVRVKVGSIAHPMEEEHHIEWIEVITKDKIYRKFLQPGDAPEADFEIVEDIIAVREYCNLHGLWKSV